MSKKWGSITDKRFLQIDSFTLFKKALNTKFASKNYCTFVHFFKPSMLLIYFQKLRGKFEFNAQIGRFFIIAFCTQN
jgi:hypothetical protein